jgi:hypothetical protein
VEWGEEDAEDEEERVEDDEGGVRRWGGTSMPRSDVPGGVKGEELAEKAGPNRLPEAGTNLRATIRLPLL